MNYARAIYLIGRSHRQVGYDDAERAEIICFIAAMAASRPEIAQVIRLENYSGGFEMQSDVCLGKNLQRICKFIKYSPLTDVETTLCDSLFECVWNGRMIGSYARKIAAGILEVLINGLGNQHGWLEVLIDGIETGQLEVAVNGIGD